jgi:ABC-type branched-subunit amino acid transport system ATPase component/ABC-type branched-subunit amino acid transport system permease subunit
VTDHLAYLLTGLGNGAVYAALGLALVVTFRSSGVINFATGAIALYAAYTYANLRTGKLIIIIPGISDIHLGTKLDFWPAFVMALVVNALVGLLLYAVVFRPLRAAPPVAKAVASLGVMIVLQELMVQGLGTDPLSVDPIFKAPLFNVGTFQIGKQFVLWDRVYLAVAILVVGLALAAAFRFTRFGLATRASAETEKGALATGLSPDRIASINWMISAVVAGIGGILIASIVPLVPLSYTLFIVPALAAALIGQFQWLAPTVIAGLLIGMVQSDLTFQQALHDWIPQGAPQLVPLLVIVVVLVVRGRPLPSRGALIQRTLGRAPRPHGVFRPTVVGTIAGVAGFVLLTGSWRSALLTTVIMAVIALSLVVVTGYCGQVSLVQLTLAGASGYLLATLSTDSGVPFPLAPLIAAFGATLLGVVVGLPALRVRGLQVGIATLALSTAIEAVWFTNSDLNGGLDGSKVTGAKVFGLDFGVGSGHDYPRLEFCFMALFVLVVVGVCVATLRRSRLGSAMLAVRANERSAAAAGVNVVRTKILAFGIAAFIAGIGGALLGYQQTFVTVNTFNSIAGLVFFGTVYLAGITSVSGGVLAGVLAGGGLSFVALDRWVNLGDWYVTVTGILLVFTVIMNPEGIVGPLHVLVARLRARRTAGVPPTAPAPSEPAAVAEPALATASEPPATVGGIVTLEDVGVRYGGVVAVQSVSFEVPSGSIVGLIGPNGAGKTTLIDAISGFAPYSGSVLLDGTKLDGLKPHQRVRHGLSRTFQAIELYDDLSVVENVMVGAAGARTRSTENFERIFDVLGLQPMRETAAGDLSQGQRQLVSIARVLVANPKILLLDEPAAGLDTTESAWLADRLREVRSSGVTILLVDHDMGFVLGLCDSVNVLDFGEIIASGTPSEIRTDRRVTDAYLGSTHAEPAVTP